MKQVIKNRKGLKLVVDVDVSDKQRGPAFVIHGLGGTRNAAHIRSIARVFKEKGLTVVLPDITNNGNESDGESEKATTTNHFEDQEDVINWTKAQPWYEEPFVLVGHSLGGITAALYAEIHPEQVKALAPISTVVTGKLSAEAPKYKLGEIDEWEKTGWREYESSTKPGLMKRYPWSHMEDRFKYDLLKKANSLIMPVLLIVGENDTSTPPEHQQILYDKLPGPKELHIIKGAPHSFVDPGHLKEIKQIFLRWIDKEILRNA